MNKNELQIHINNKLSDIASVLPSFVDQAPASFECGHATGYKQALLDIDRKLLDDSEYI